MEDYHFEKIVMGPQDSNLKPLRGGALKPSLPGKPKMAPQIIPITVSNLKAKSLIADTRMIKITHKSVVPDYQIDQDFVRTSYSIIASDRLKDYNQSDIDQVMSTIRNSKESALKNPKLAQIKALEIVRKSIQRKLCKIRIQEELIKIIEEEKKKPAKKRNGELAINFRQNTISRLLDYLSDDNIFDQMDTISMLRNTFNVQGIKEQSEEDSCPASSSSISSADQKDLPALKCQASSNRRLLEDLTKWKNTLVEMMRRM